jgi:urease accessory protein
LVPNPALLTSGRVGGQIGRALPHVMAAAAFPAGWQAGLTLGFQRQHARTILGLCAHRGPLQVQRPFYPEGSDLCHVALLHPPGGVVGGDSLRIDVILHSGARALVTTPAAGKFYRSAGPCAWQIQHLRVAAGATLEWLPQENILYNGARVHAGTHVELQGDARFLGWDILCLGRPAAGERFASGACRQNFELWRDGEPLYLERGRYAGGDSVLDARWGLQGQPVSATLACVGAAPEAVAAIRAGWEACGALAPAEQSVRGEELTAATHLDGVLVCRYLGSSTARARRLLTLAWSLLRPKVFGRPPCPSRFWNT